MLKPILDEYIIICDKILNKISFLLFHKSYILRRDVLIIVCVRVYDNL